MPSGSQRSKRRDAALSTLGGFIQALGVAKDICGVPLAQIALASACILLTTIKDTMDHKDDYIVLGLSCAEVCGALDRGLNGKRSDKLSEPVQKAVEKLVATVADIQRRVDEKNTRSAFSRAFHAQSDKDAILAWQNDLNKILHIFNTELAIDTNVTVTDSHREVTSIHQEVANIHQDVLEIKENVSNKHLVQTSIPVGESPPPAPKAFFGRETLIEEIVDLAVKFEPIALIGAGGIGKTSIALTVLHHPRIKDQFGDNRRFIRCDKFTPSLATFLARLSKVIGAGIENPEDMTPLRPFLSSNKMLIIIDNSESLLDLEGTDNQEIFSVVDELCQFHEISVCMTSRITMVPEHCKHPEIPTLSMEAARDIFYGIYNDHGRSSEIDDLLRRLEFHALSITLLAATASQNRWNHNRLTKEWNARRVEVLQTNNNRSLAATIKLSLDSPTFLKLGPDARDLLGVIAFFPQGINENHLDWLFPAIPDIQSTFDKFCALSLTHRNDCYITMLAPIRDQLTPHDPASSYLLCATKDQYFARLSVNIFPGRPGFEEAQWIMLEDANVEHLLSVFTSIDATADNIWDACCSFVKHLYWHKPRKTTLESKIECLPDAHPSKPQCLLQLSELLGQLGNCTERKRVLTCALGLERERGDQPSIAQTLMLLCDANRWLDLYEEAIRQAREALEIFRQLGDTAGQADSLNCLAAVLYYADQLDAAENAALRAIDLVTEKGQELLVCQSHGWLGNIYRYQDRKEKAIHHYKIALDIASRFKFHSQLFWTHLRMANLFLDEDEFDQANAHVRQAKLHVGNDVYNLGRAMDLQARIWHSEHKLEAAKPEASRALEIFAKLGAAEDVERCEDFLWELDSS